jgi:hypothetical protein
MILRYFEWLVFTPRRNGRSPMGFDIGFLAPKARDEIAQGEALGCEIKKQALKGRNNKRHTIGAMSPLQGLVFSPIQAQGFAPGSLIPRLWR